MNPMPARRRDQSVKNKRPKKCPKCGHSPVAVILWGMPAWSKQMEKDEKAGRLFIGGCCVTENDPQWHCNKCGHEWGFKRKRRKHHRARALRQVVRIRQNRAG